MNPNTCPQCGTQIPAGVPTCPFCGAALSENVEQTTYPLTNGPDRTDQKSDRRTVRVALAIIGLLVLVLAVAIGVFFVQNQDPQEGPKVAPSTTQQEETSEKFAPEVAGEQIPYADPVPQEQWDTKLRQIFQDAGLTVSSWGAPTKALGKNDVFKEMIYVNVTVSQPATSALRDKLAPKVQELFQDGNERATVLTICDSSGAYWGVSGERESFPVPKGASAAPSGVTHSGSGLTPAPVGVVGSTGTGTGDDVVTDIQIADPAYVYRVHFTNDGESNFIVHSYDSGGEEEILINEIGGFDGYVPLVGQPPYTFEIKSSGSWSYTVEAIPGTKETSFSGNGHIVTPIFRVIDGIWSFTHSGKSNFIVKLYTLDGTEIVVNEIGTYEGRCIVNVPKGSNGFLEIIADGNWTAGPANEQ